MGCSSSGHASGEPKLPQKAFGTAETSEATPVAQCEADVVRKSMSCPPERKSLRGSIRELAEIGSSNITGAKSHRGSTIVGAVAGPSISGSYRKSTVTVAGSKTIKFSDSTHHVDLEEDHAAIHSIHRSLPEDSARNPDLKAVLQQHDGRDPRWNHQGFNDCADECEVRFVKVGFLRHLMASGGTFPPAQCLPQTASHVGAPPHGVDLYYVVHPWLGKAVGHPDPFGKHLGDLTEILDRHGAEDDDLVLFDFMAAFQPGSFMQYTDQRSGHHLWHWNKDSGEDLRTEYQKLQKDNTSHFMSRFGPTYCAMKTIVLHKHLPADQTISSSIWITYELMMASYCQHIINSKDPEVQQWFKPELLVDPVKMLQDGAKSGLLTASQVEDLEKYIQPSLVRTLDSMTAVIDDQAGFAAFCHGVQMAWLKLEYLRSFANRFREPPFPRRQELPRGAFFMGLPPGRKFVLSHPWGAENHPGPRRRKIQLVVEALDRCGATEHDGLFFDYGSLFQQKRPQPKGCNAQRERSSMETKLFKLSLQEMSRLYAHRQCEVIVLPHVDVEEFVCDRRELSKPNGPGKGLKHQDWGWINEHPYENRGWCAAEFACALYADIIVNIEDPEVQHVLRCRHWPTSVVEYRQMLEDESITFFHKADNAYVSYLFFKMCFAVKGNNGGGSPLSPGTGIAGTKSGELKQRFQDLKETALVSETQGMRVAGANSEDHPDDVGLNDIPLNLHTNQLEVSTRHGHQTESRMPEL